MELTFMEQEINIQENGLMIFNKVKDVKLGLMVHNITDNIIKEKEMEKENIYGQMVVIMMENGMII